MGALLNYIVHFYCNYICTEAFLTYTTQTCLHENALNLKKNDLIDKSFCILLILIVI